MYVCYSSQVIWQNGRLAERDKRFGEIRGLTRVAPYFASACTSVAAGREQWRLGGWVIMHLRTCAHKYDSNGYTLRLLHVQARTSTCNLHCNLACMMVVRSYKLVQALYKLVQVLYKPCTSLYEPCLYESYGLVQARASVQA